MMSSFNLKSPKLKARGLTISVGRGKQRKTLLREAHLSLSTGEWVALVGPSGVGKTTLLHVLSGLYPYERGEIWIEGEKATQQLQHDRLRIEKMGLIFQGAYMVGSLSVWENVALPARLASQGFVRNIVPTKEKLKERAHMLLKQVGLENAADHLPHVLSFGERRRLAIARAFFLNPPIILADEPTNDLDPDNVARVLALLRAYQAEGGAILIATHQQEPLFYADRKLYIEEGSLKEENDMKEEGE